MTSPVGQRELLFNAVRPDAPGVGRRARAPFTLRDALPWAAILLITLCWDRAVYLHVTVSDPAAAAAMKDAGWYITLRALGTMYPWIAIAIVLFLVDWQAHAPERRDPPRRAVFLLLCPLLAGAAAELLKPLVGRFKPEETDGWFALASLPDRWSRWSDLGMASSHTAVAFGASFALATLFPRAAPLFLAGGVGCAMTRLLAGGHFLSDVYVGILLAYFITRLVRWLDLRNNAGRPLGA